MPGNPKVHRDVALLNELDEEMIFLMFEEGKSISEICIGMGVSKRALDTWIADNDYEAKITRARVEAASHLACETLTIADSMDVDNGQRDVQRIRTRQWLAERWDRKTYGVERATRSTSASRVYAWRRCATSKWLSSYPQTRCQSYPQNECICSKIKQKHA